MAEMLAGRGRFLAAAAVASLVFLLVRAALGPDSGVVEGTPSELVGTWETTDERYADRAFILREGEFWLQVASDSVVPYRIREIRRFDRVDHEEYQVTYYTREGSTTQVFQRYPDGTLRLKNPPDAIWRRR